METYLIFINLNVSTAYKEYPKRGYICACAQSTLVLTDGTHNSSEVLHAVEFTVLVTISFQAVCEHLAQYKSRDFYAVSNVFSQTL